MTEDLKEFEEMSFAERMLYAIGFGCYVISGFLFIYWVLDKSILVGSFCLFVMGLIYMNIGRRKSKKKLEKKHWDRTGI